ncbi:heavy metal translocating P-type ATPase [Ostreiculturibacter nitratireducens]|uniref:heavy metal translocating P-type ATPase n=1 Tax=Ostreiculturibacter nitratireducens TaxID=3075226 RepID=UPI0031B576A6
MTQTLRLNVEGMTCASCTARVERALRAQPGVTAASANFATGAVTADFDAPADPAVLAEAVRSAGYGVTVETARLDVDGMTCASCTGRVERTLMAQPGVLAAEVNLATKGATVRYAAGVTSPTELAMAVGKAGYEARPSADSAPEARLDRAAAEIARLRRDFYLSAVLSLPVVVLAMGPHMYPPMHHWIAATIGETTSWLIQMVLTALVLIFPGRRFLTIGIPALLKGVPEMNSLVAIGALAGFAYSSVATLAPSLLPEHARAVYFEAAAVIVTLILLGRLLEARAKGQAGEAIKRLVGLRPETATVERPGGSVVIPITELRPGDIVLLSPGERVAADGVVTDGETWIDESMLTGEPAPVAKRPGDPVTGGTVNGTSALSFRVTAVGADTVLSRIVRMVEDAQGGKLPVQALVDRITRWFVPVVMTLSAITFLLWLALGPAPSITNALVAAISVLIIACPCAMGLATPVSILVGTGRGAELGLLYRRGDALQRLAETGIVAFDKTGTLTEGTPRVTAIACADGMDEARVLTLAASVEARSEHPLARAITAEAGSRGLMLLKPARVAATPGKGLTAEVEGTRVVVGNRAMLVAEGIDPAALAARATALAEEAMTPVFVALDGKAVAILGISDPVKPGARVAIEALHGMGLKTAMISGDMRATADAVARSLGIDRVVAEVLPEGKVAALATLREDASTLAFVGDGINDAPALASSDVGLAIGTGTDVAIESAEVVLMTGDPGAVSDAIRLSRATMRNIRQNLFWAFGYNVVLIPVAAGVLYPLNGLLLSPMLAAGAMALSSVFVVTNALRLRRAGPWRGAAS